MPRFDVPWTVTFTNVTRIVADTPEHAAELVERRYGKLGAEVFISVVDCETHLHDIDIGKIEPLAERNESFREALDRTGRPP